MSFFFLKLFTFVMFFQPVYIFPSLAPIRPYLTSAIIAIVTYFLYINRETKPFLSNKYTQYFILFIIMQILSASSIWLRGGLNALFAWLNFIIIFYLITKQCTQEKQIRSIIIMVIASIAYLSYYSIENYQAGTRASGFGWYENANDMVLILISVIPLVFYLIESSRYKLMRYIYLGLAGLFAFNIILCGSRQGLLGLAIVGSISLLFIHGLPKILRTGLMTVLIISIFTTGLSVVLQRDDLEGQISGDASSEDRIVQWKACLRMLRDHPILGIGPGESVYAMRDYGGVRGLPPHNTLIQVFAETGIPGGVFFVLFSCYPIWDAWKYFRKKRAESKGHRILSDAHGEMAYRYLTFALVGFWTCAFFSNRVQFSILYVLIALIVAIQQNIFAGIQSLADMQGKQANLLNNEIIQPQEVK